MKSLPLRKYLYSAAGSQAAVDTILMAPLEATLSGFEPDELLRSRGAGIAGVVMGVHYLAKRLRKKSLKLFNISDEQVYVKGLHDSLFFSTANAIISGSFYYPIVAGCDPVETLIATGITSGAYVAGGWYIGQGMDKADHISDKGVEPVVQKEKMRSFNPVGQWYWNLSPRKQLWTNTIAAAAAVIGSVVYANNDHNPVSLEDTLQNSMEEKSSSHVSRQVSMNNTYLLE